MTSGAQISPTVFFMRTAASHVYQLPLLRRSLHAAQYRYPDYGFADITVGVESYSFATYHSLTWEFRYHFGKL